MTNFLVIGSILFIVGIAVAYIVKAKKSGVKCIGCPSAGQCSEKKKVIPCVIADAIVQKNRRFSEKACTLEKGCGLSVYKT